MKKTKKRAKKNMFPIAEKFFAKGNRAKFFKKGRAKILKEGR